MGRSRTMNYTRFAIYIAEQTSSSSSAAGGSGVLSDIKKHALTRELYVRNCTRKIVGNLSSIYQTLVSLFNLSQ
eukprot:139560-Pyramimonas_sp.AAC.1